MKKRSIHIPISSGSLEGFLQIPTNAQGIVLFVHGSGSGRFSPRNQFVANYLNEQNIATLLIDLLTTREEEVDERTREFRFSIELLTSRVVQITDWLAKDSETKSLALGYFGASTGAAAALGATTMRPIVTAVVSRGGRPDLARSILSQVKTPTLLIVGEHDIEVIQMNEEALKLLNCPKKLVIIPRATHLFEEPGCLEKVAQISSEWFSEHFKKGKNV